MEQKDHGRTNNGDVLIMKKIELTQGKYALVDDEDFEWLNKWKWCCDTNGYAVRHEQKNEYGSNPRKMIKMHKFILNPKIGMMTDHINRNKLDNRKCNLRMVDNHTNQRNSKLSVMNKSGYKGVYWDKKWKKWCARITVFGKKIFGGGFSNKVEASKSYERMVLIYG